MSFPLDHHRKHLHESGLTDETIDIAGIYSATDPLEAGCLLNWSGPGRVPSIVFPQFDRDGKVCGHILRPDAPRERDGKTVKYETPVDSEPRLYFPPAQLIAAGGWGDVSAPLILTEGIKKALKIVQTGGLAISAQGTTVWHDIGHRQATKEWQLHPDFAGVPLRGRTVYVGFDGGDTTDKPAVITAEARLGRMLLDVGADVRLIRVPFVDGKHGIDDYLATQPDPPAALHALLDDAIRADPRLRAKDAVAADDDAVLRLLSDLSFAAALEIAPPGLLDLVVRELKTARVTKASLKSALERFDERRRAAAISPRKEGEQVDPAVKLEAAALVRRPDLLKQFQDDLEADGVVGEHEGARTLLLVVVSRRSERPIHVVVKAASASGKNWLVERVVRYLPESDVIEISDMTPRALQYLPGSMKGKVIVITEHEGAERAEYALRIAMSEGNVSVLVPEKVEDTEGSRIETHRRVVEGPASFITTTTRASLHDENETRIMEVTLDESEEQTGRILMAQAKAAAAPRAEADVAMAARRRQKWQEAFRLLDKTRARVPQAIELVASFPTKRIRARRDFRKILAFTEAHALLHQYQREIVDGEVIATNADVEAAKKLCSTLYDDSTPALKRMVEKLKSALGSSPFTARTAAKALGHSDDAVRRSLKRLVELELVDELEQGKGSMPSTYGLVGVTPTDPEAAKSSSGSAHVASPPAPPAAEPFQAGDAYEGDSSDPPTSSDFPRWSDDSLDIL